MANILLTVETNLARELIGLIDEKLSELSRKSTETEIADLLGYFDSMEHLTGLGFVTCQTYMTAVYGITKVDKKTALSFGPFHSYGASIAEVVNAAANYWKHNNEWSLDKTPKRREAIEATFKDIGFPIGTEYPLSGILTELAEPDDASFMPVMNKLRTWENEVQNAA